MYFYCIKFTQPLVIQCNKWRWIEEVNKYFCQSKLLMKFLILFPVPSIQLDSRHRFVFTDIGTSVNRNNFPFLSNKSGLSNKDKSYYKTSLN